MKATFDDETFTFAVDGEEVDVLTAKGASAGVAREAKANLALLSQRLQNEQITLQEWYSGMKREIKMLHMAEFSLSRGGIDQVREWSRVEEIIAEQWSGNADFPGLRRFAENIQNGRYGTQTLSSGVLARGASYANAGRVTYENERLAARMEKHDLEARRVLGAPESHCRNCPNWAALGWMDAETMYERYAIGMSTCGASCYCVIVTRRKTDLLSPKKDSSDDEKQQWKSLAPALRTAAIMGSNLKKASAYSGALLTVLALFRYAGKSPAAMRFALGLLRTLLNSSVNYL